MQQDQWQDPEDRPAPHLHPAPSQSSKLHTDRQTDSSHQQQPSAQAQYLSSGYEQPHQDHSYRPPSRHLSQQQQQSYSQPAAAATPAGHNYYYSEYDSQPGFNDAYYAASSSKPLQAAPYELYADPAVSAAPFELYPYYAPAPAPAPAGPYSISGSAQFQEQGHRDPYPYNGQSSSYPAGLSSASGAASVYGTGHKSYQQKQQADPLAFLSGQQQGANPTAAAHVTQGPQHGAADPYGATWWDGGAEQAYQTGSAEPYHSQASTYYQAPTRDRQRQRQGQYSKVRLQAYVGCSMHVAPGW